MHMARQVTEIRALRRSLPHLREIMDQRDQAFAEGATDQGLRDFAKRSQLACRRCDARLCSTAITDSGVAAVAEPFGSLIRASERCYFV